MHRNCFVRDVPHDGVKECVPDASNADGNGHEKWIDAEHESVDWQNDGGRSVKPNHVRRGAKCIGEFLQERNFFRGRFGGV